METKTLLSQSQETQEPSPSNGWLKEAMDKADKQEGVVEEKIPEWVVEKLIGKEGEAKQRTWWCLCDNCKGNFVCYEDRRAIRAIKDHTAEVHQMYRKIDALERVVKFLINEMTAIDAHSPVIKKE